MNTLTRTLRGNIRQYGMIIALAAIVILFQIITDGILLKPLNVSNLVVQNAQILILAIGMVLVIVARHIDLSVGSVAAFVGAVGAILMTKHDVPWLLAVILCLALGALIGAWDGFWGAYVGIPAFIVTLASMLLFRGLTLVVLEGATVGGLPEGFKDIGNGFLPEVGPDTGLHNLTMALGVLLVAVLVVLDLRKRAASQRYNFDVLPLPLFLIKQGVIGAVIIEFSYLLADARGLPIVGLILFVLIAVYTFIMKRTIFGRLVMGVLNNGMSLQGVSIDWQQAIKGLVLLVAVAFDVWNKKRTAGGGGAGAEKPQSTAPPP